MNLRYTLRTLLRAPGFTAISILTLALGIGINTVVFSIYEAVVMKPIAARAPGELVRIRGRQGDQPLDTFTAAEFEQIGQAKTLAGAIATSEPQILVGEDGGHSEVLRARLVSDNYFEALGVTPRLGRGLQARDTHAAVVSYRFWNETLHGDPAVLTRSIRVHNAVLDIVGVAPENFAGTGLPPQMPDLWIPMSAQPEVLPGIDWLHNSASREWQVLARRKMATGVAQVSAELEVLARNWPLVNGKPAHLGARPATFFQTDSGEGETFASVCGILLAAVGLILLIGSINLVNLLFARHAAREREFAVRIALGARRQHLIRQLCTESLVLGLGGGALGLVFSLWGCEWIRAAIDSALLKLSNGGLSLYLDLTPDWRIFGFAALVSSVVGLAIGLWPAAWASRRNLSAEMKTGAEGYRRLWSKRGLLIAAQVAGCLMLLAGAGMLFRGVWRSGDANPGFETRHLMMMSIDSRTLAPTAAARVALVQRVQSRMESLPSVASIALSERVPFVGHTNAGFVTEGGKAVRSLFNSSSERYFETMGLRLVAGRAFTRDEVDRDDAVAVISDVTAKNAWPGQDPIGRKLLGMEFRGARHKSATVIGVVKAVRSTYLSKPDHGFVYLPGQIAGGVDVFLVRTRDLPETATRSILAALGAENANLPSQTLLLEVEKGPMQIQRLMSEAPAGAAAILGIIALLLSALGIFALVAQLVAQRTREIAIRVALGAGRREVIGLVLRQTLRPVTIGMVIGLAGAAGISMLLRSMIVVPDMPDFTYGGGAFPPSIFLASVAVLLGVILFASFVPVRRATKIEPAEALRSE